MPQTNRPWRAYYNRYIKLVKSEDRIILKNVSSTLKDIGVYTGAVLEDWVAACVIDDEGHIDYGKLLRLSRGAVSKIESFSAAKYSSIGSAFDKFTAWAFMRNCQEVDNTLSGFGFRKKQVMNSVEQWVLEGPTEGSEVRAFFRATPSASFKRQMKKQLEAGTSPALRIKTISQDHVKLVQIQMMKMYGQGKSYGWVGSEVVKQMYPAGVDKAIRKRMEYNIERIARTSYRDAVNADQLQFILQNPSIFYGARRTADGRPCIACIIRDGEFIPPDSVLDDHPNGMCIAVPLMYPEEVMQGKPMHLPKTTDNFGLPLVQKFMDYPAMEQQKILGRGMYNLWKSTKFDIRQIINTSSSTPRPLWWVSEHLSQLGTTANPSSFFISGGHYGAGGAKTFVTRLDPWDRSLQSKGDVVLRDRSKFHTDLRTVNRLDPFGDGSDIMSSSLSDKVKAKMLAKYPLRANMDFFADLHWTTFNDYAREIGIWTRKSVTGARYYMVPAQDAMAAGYTPVSFIGTPLPALSTQQQIELLRNQSFTSCESWKTRFAENITPDELLDRYEPKFRKAIDKKRDKIDSLTPTHKKYRLPDKTWTPERQKLHQKIINDYLNPEAMAKATPANGQAPEYVMFGGRGGSGKGSFTKLKSNGGLQVIEEDRYIVLDADKIKDAFKSYGYEGWNAFLFHEESSYLMKEITRQAFKARVNIVHDMTMKNAPKMFDRAKQFYDAGYTVKGYYMHLPPQEAANRAIFRFYTQKHDFSGRFVPPEIVLDMQNCERAFDNCMQFFKEWQFYDNQGIRGTVPRLIASGGS